MAGLSGADAELFPRIYVYTEGGHESAPPEVYGRENRGFMATRSSDSVFSQGPSRVQLITVYRPLFTDLSDSR